MRWRWWKAVLMLVVLPVAGCTTTRGPHARTPETSRTSQVSAGGPSAAGGAIERAAAPSLAAGPSTPSGSEQTGTEPQAHITPVSFDEAELAPDSSMPAAAQETPAAESGEHGAGPNPMNGSTGTAPSTGVPSSLAYDDPSGLSLESVIGSVYRSFPLLQAALFARTIALGEQVAASGEFDLKLKGASENGPLGFYETYRHSVGLVQPTYFGGEVFAGYRIGRGEFQPWYLERETNDGGEFKAGVGLPLLQDVDIDPRRAALWQAQYGRFLVEPEIQAQLIAFVQEASYVYWAWVAAGANDRIANRVLLLAEDRTDRIRAQVEAGFIDPPELTDNLRLVAERRGKLADAQRKLQQSAAKLSLYWRDVDGRPLFPSPGSVPQFPELSAAVPETVEVDIQLALQNRPELAVIDWQRRQLEVEHAQAENTALPDLDVVVSGSQDVGRPTSPKRDKSQFELEAGLFLDVPLQRRKARGKMTALEGKLAQLLAKRQMVADKIVVDVQSAAFALAAALEQVKQAREAVRLAEDLAERERLNLEQGLSDLLKVTLREQYAAEAAEKEVAALLQYFLALADYRAALGMDRQP